MDDAWDALAEQAHDMRATAARGVLASSDDGGQAQTADLTSHASMQRSGVEVIQVYGLASRPPTAGAVAIVIAVGGDPGDLVALPAAHPGYRYGGLAEGEAVLYTAEGTRVALRVGGVIEIKAATQVTITAPAIVINGNVTVNGSVDATGQVSDGAGSLARLRGRYDGHVHGSSPTTSQPD